MYTIFVFGVFWSIYGVLGLLGIQLIPEKYKTVSWSKKYKQFRGLSWLFMGIPWLVLYFVLKNSVIPYFDFCIILIGAALPSLIFSVISEANFAKKLEKEQKN